jgi:tRNA (guanine37-N1)-methyltransferase
MRIQIVTIFPGVFEKAFDYGIVQQARKKGLLEIETVDLREFASDRHRTVDDRPYGGGEGMVLKPEPVFRAVESCAAQEKDPGYSILLSPQGRRFDQSKAKELSLKTRLIMVCGRYEGVDQRVADHLVDEELSVGDFVLSGGEFGAMVVIDAISRLIPGVLGCQESALRESFMDGLLDYPQFTRPAEFRGWKVPEILLSGDHTKIEAWREQQALTRTCCRRPDLLGSGDGYKEKDDECGGSG